MEKDEWKPAHKVMEDLLRRDPLKHAITIAKICAEGMKVPAKNIPSMLEALWQAKRMPVEANTDWPPFIQILNREVDAAIVRLKAQLKEVEEKDEDKKPSK